MKKKIEEVINHVQKSDKVSEENKPLILEKLEECQIWYLQVDNYFLGVP